MNKEKDEYFLEQAGINFYNINAKFGISLLRSGKLQEF